MRKIYLRLLSIVVSAVLFHVLLYQFNWVKTPLKYVSSPSLFDKRPIQQPLETYPNDIPNLYECDIAVLRYRCDLDEQLGCRAYPQLFPSGDIFNNWSPYRPESIPIKTYSSICRFNISSPVRMTAFSQIHATLYSLV